MVLGTVLLTLTAKLWTRKISEPGTYNSIYRVLFLGKVQPG